MFVIDSTNMLQTDRQRVFIFYCCQIVRYLETVYRLGGRDGGHLMRNNGVTSVKKVNILYFQIVCSEIL